MRIAAVLSTFALVFAAPYIAKADTFTITGTGETITFDLPASPTPDVSQANVGFLFRNVATTQNGQPLTVDVGFGNVNQGAFPDLFLGVNESITPTSISGGDPSYGYFLGDMLYSGTEANPTFLVGSFPLLNLAGIPVGEYTFTASAPAGTGVTPEPSSFLLLGTGLAGFAGAVRRRLA